MPDLSSPLGGGLGGALGDMVGGVDAAVSDVGETAAGVLGGVGGAATAVLGAAGPTAGGVIAHVASAGETLSDVADAHGVDTPSLVAANPQLSAEAALPPGIRVAVPLPASSAQAGDEPGADVSLSNAAGLAAAASAAGEASDAAGSRPAAGLPSGGGDWRVMTQATTPAAAEEAEDVDPAPLLVVSSALVASAGAEADAPPAELIPLLTSALLGAGQGSLPPELQAATPLSLAVALFASGFTAVDTAAAQPGDVVLVLHDDGLHAELIPREGALAFAPLTSDEEAGALQAETAAVILRLPDTVLGLDAPLHSTRRRRRGRRGSAAHRAFLDLRAAWLDRLIPVAQWINAKWGLPISLVVAQATLVSDWGRTAPDNDYFGVRRARAAGRAATPPRNGRGLDLPAYASLDEAADDFAFTLAAALHGQGSRGDLHAALAATAPFVDVDRRHAERVRVLIALNRFSDLDG